MREPSITTVQTPRIKTMNNTSDKLLKERKQNLNTFFGNLFPMIVKTIISIIISVSLFSLFIDAVVFKSDIYAEGFYVVMFILIAFILFGLVPAIVLFSITITKDVEKLAEGKFIGIIMRVYIVCIFVVPWIAGLYYYIMDKEFDPGPLLLWVNLPSIIGGISYIILSRKLNRDTKPKLE